MSLGRSVVCDPSGRSDISCFACSVLSEHQENRRMAAENISERDPLSPEEEDNLLSEENESANPNGDPPKLGSSVTEDALLNEIAQDFESDEQTDPKVAQKLADIVNKRWGSKLEEAKLKEQLAKYN